MPVEIHEAPRGPTDIVNSFDRIPPVTPRDNMPPGRTGWDCT